MFHQRSCPVELLQERLFALAVVTGYLTWHLIHLLICRPS
jgi:hypothetical protein